MANDAAQAFASSNRGVVVAAAGCGKTELIAQAARYAQDRPQLILTHTHAGVDALKRRLASLKVPTRTFQVRTIAGFAFRYSSAYPGLSGVALTDGQPDWSTIYSGAARAFTRRHIRSVLRASYGGIYVDEYQDCVLSQHELILRLAEVLPCRIVGDPLQGIFGFGSEPIVTWGEHVDPNFDRLPDLTMPWRWRGTNPVLGQWLAGARSALLRGDPLDLRTRAIQWHRKTPQAQSRACFAHARQERQTCVVIHRLPNLCYHFARRMKGVFTCMEEIECKDLVRFCDLISRTAGPARAVGVIDFAGTCLTKAKTELKGMRKRFATGAMPTSRQQEKYPEIASRLSTIAAIDDLALVPSALRAIRALPGSSLYRRELYREMIRALRNHSMNPGLPLSEIAWHLREQLRHAGRAPDRRTVARTYLIKGLQFDHAIVLDADALDAKNLYVAMTRGARSLTILSQDPWIRKAQQSL